MTREKHILVVSLSKISIFLFFVFFFTLFSTKASALTLDKKSYISGETIMTTDEGGPYIIFELSNGGAPVGGGYSYTVDGAINSSSPFNRGKHAIVEFTYLDIPCFLESQTYDQCKEAPEFVTEALFNVNPATSGDNGEDFTPPLDPELNPTKDIGIILYPPEVSISSIPKDSFFSDKLNISYSAIDQNDLGNDNVELMYGLGENPVTISYSDKTSDDFGFLPSVYKLGIAKDQPAKGSYPWSVKNLKEGSLYRIIIDAVDKVGMYGQAISEFFGVDFSAPVFTVKVNPQAVRSGNVTISVDSSEDLSKAPEVKIIQEGGTPQTVVMTGEQNHFEGIYKVLSGFDGPAVVKVTGTDVASNLSTSIVSGGTFSVGVNPPPKPKINNYLEKIVTNSEFINMSGNVRPDTEVVLSVNGVEISKIKPEKDGSFAFNQIKLDKTKNNGTNYIDIVSIDTLGTSSESSLSEVKYNIAPTVAILNPKDKETLSNIYNINVNGDDENNDTLFYTYQILSLSKYKNKIYDWVTISDGNPSKSFSWNTSELEDGTYVLQVKVSDKNAETISLPITINIKNVLPSFLFEDGRNTVTNQPIIIVKGKAITSTNLSPRPGIASVAYSMDNGLTWTPVSIKTMTGDYEKRFAVTFENLTKEGTSPVLWRTKDTRGFIGLITHPIVIDKTNPKIPTILYPRIELGKDTIINDSNDENSKKEGIQINIKGKTEAFNNVTLNYNNQIVSTKALATGEFTFKDVTFDKKGKYNLEIFATDLASNVGTKTSFSVLYNNSPIISFINPKAFRGISGNANISWSIKDPDGDALSNIIVSYRNKDKDALFKTLVSNANAIGNYNWNTSNLPESNNYELKISVSDGYSIASLSESFSIDRTLPILTSFVFDKNLADEKNKQSSFIAKGEATDNLSGIEYVEYSLEGSDGIKTPWYKGIITTGYLKNKATYQIKHPLVSEDGGYKVYARAVDTSGNVSAPLTLSLSLDKTAPRIGGFFFEKNNVDLIPDEQGNILIYKNTFFKFNISLEEDTDSALLRVGGKEYKLEKDIKTGLWFTSISVNSDNIEKLFITAQDSSLNKVEDKEIGSVTASKRGVVILSGNNNQEEPVVDASISVLKLNEETNQYNEFILSDNSSIIKSNQSGEYDLILPAGQYRFVISGTDIKTSKEKFTLNRPSVVSIDFKVSKISKLMTLIREFLTIFK